MTVTRDRLYINGSWVKPEGETRMSVWESATGDEMGSVVMGTSEDVDAAVGAAAAAFPAWRARSVEDRAKYLHAITENLFGRIDETVEIFMREVGTVRSVAIGFQSLAASQFASHAQMARTFEWDQHLTNSTVTHEPVGVVGAITPWNFPLLLACVKLAPALAAGCTVVLKPAEIAPLTAFLLAEAVDAAGLPAGVFNLVTGTGTEVGEAIVSHPLVDMISFTGSTRAGRRIGAVAAETVKRVSLELGGKSACVVLDDGDLTEAVNAAMTSVTYNNGQGCACLSRIIVPRNRLDEAAQIAAGYVDKLVIGDPRDETTTLGPLASEEHRSRVEGYIQKGIDEGAKVVVGGVGRPDGQPTGFFVSPTVFVTDDPTSTIATEEIFGPVQTIIAHDGDDDAIRIANSTIYGLAGSVFSADPTRASRVAGAMRSGQVDINGVFYDFDAPMGGYKQSGNGRAFGLAGFTEFLELKAIATAR